MFPKRLLTLALFAALAVMPTCVLRAQWQPMNGLYGGEIQTSASNEQETFVFAAGYGLSRTTDHGLNWIPSNKGISLGGNTALIGGGGIILLSTDSAIYLWSDSSSEWIKRGKMQAESPYISSYIGSDGAIFVGTNTTVPPTTDIERSTDQGLTWEIVSDSININPYSDVVSGFAVIDSSLFVGTNTGKLFRSSDLGNNWSYVDSGSAASEIACLSADGRNLLAGTSLSTILISSDLGVTWETLTNNPGWTEIINLTILGNTILAGTPQGLFYSTDDGSSWQSPLTLPQDWILSLTSNGETLFAGTGSYGVFISYDTGKSWVLANTGESVPASSLMPCGNTLYANVGGAILRSKDSGYTWSFYLDGVHALANSTLNTISSIASLGPNFYAGSNGVFLTTDNGNTWIPRDSGLPADYVVSLISKNSKLFAGTKSNGVFVSSDSGATWNEANNGLSSELQVLALSAAGNDIMVESSSPPYGVIWGIFISSDEGQTWVSHSTPQGDLKFVTSIDTFIFAISDFAGMYRSSIHNQVWVLIGDSLEDISAIMSFDSMFFAGSQNGFFVSYDNGDNWVEQDSGMIDTSVRALTIFESMLYASAYSINSYSSSSPTIWRRPLSEMTTSPYILGASADTINFGTIPVGKDSLQFVTITNDGKAAVTIESFPITQSQNAFITSDLSSEVILNPGEHFTFEVLFTPTQPGVYTANIGIVSEAKRINITLIGTANGVAGVEPQSEFSSIVTAAPNPFSQSTQISFASQSAGYAEVSIVNMLGVEVARLFSGELGAGEHNFSWDAGKNACATQGMYECLVRINGQVETQPVVLMR